MTQAELLDEAMRQLRSNARALGKIEREVAQLAASVKAHVQRVR